MCAGLVLAGCTAVPRADEPTSPSAADSAAGTTARIFVRPCESSVFGDLGARWREDATVVGPIAFVGAPGYADDPKGSFVARDPRMATAHKVLAVVSGDAPVLVSVDARDAALFYDPAQWGVSNHVPFRRGDEVTRFEPCTDDGQRTTQFNGGFLVRGPTCVPVRVEVEGRPDAVALLSFGAGTCGQSAA
jgi:hypothetical protein